MNSLKDHCEKVVLRWNQSYLLYALLILLGMYGLGQLNAPFIAHDDYDWLLKDFDQGFETPFSKAGSEGRWGNYVWSLVSHRLNGHSAFGLYLLFLSVMCLLMARVLSPRAGIFAALLIFLAPMIAHTARWPVTQVTGIAVTLIGCLALLLVRGDGGRRLVVSLSVVAGFLFYPSFGPLFLLMYAASSAGTRQSTLMGAVVYVVSFIAVVLFVFTLNYQFHGHFSIKPAAWREATPLLQGGALGGNIERYLTFFPELKDIWPALVAGSVAFAVCMGIDVRVRQCVAALLYGCMLLAMDASLSVLSGVAVPLRSTLWLWLLLCMPVIFLLNERRTALIGLLLCIPLVLVGAGTWYSQYASAQKVFPAMSWLGHALTRVQAANVGRYDDVVMFGDARVNPTMEWLHSNRALRNYLFKEFGVYSTPCAPAMCERIEAELSQRIESPEWMIVDRHLVWILSPQRDSGY